MTNSSRSDDARALAGWDRAIGHPRWPADGTGRRQKERKIIPYYPFWSITAIIIAVFVIWAVATYGRDFRDASV